MIIFEVSYNTMTIKLTLDYNEYDKYL